MLLLEDIRNAALAVGFDDCGVAAADALTDEEYPLRQWLQRGWHGELQYMERNADKRMDPRLLLPGAKTVICCVSAYPPPENEEFRMKNEESGCRNTVAAYARTRDYHKDIKTMLFQIMQRLGIDGKACCDTVPISDKHWAARAGLGWIGRHTLLVTPRWGSWVNLGEIVTTEEVEDVNIEREKVKGGCCENCGLCVKACPNQALAPDGPPMMDVRRCTAYYTTHHPRPLPSGLHTRGYSIGCDICQLACPYNTRKGDKGR